MAKSEQVPRGGSDRRKRARPEIVGQHRVGYAALLRENPAMRRLIVANFASGVGDWFNWIAALLVLTRITASYAALGTMVIMHTTLPVVLAPLSGAAADRFDRRTILITCDLLRLVLVLGLIVASRTGNATLVWLLLFGQYAVSAFYLPSAQALIPRLTSPAELKTANALFNTALMGAGAAGSMLGGLAVAAAGVEAAFVLDALTFLLSAALVMRMVYRPRAEAAADTTSPAAGASTSQHLSLWGLLRSEPRLVAAILAVMGVGIPGGLLWIVIVAIGRDLTPLGTEGAVSIGLLNAVTWIGGLVGSVAFNQWFGGNHDRDQAKGCLRLSSIRCGALVVLSLIPIAVPVVGPNIGFVFACVVLGCFCLPGGALWVAAVHFAQTYTPDRLRGRVFAMLTAIWTGGQAASVLLATVAIGRGVSLTTVCLIIAGVIVLVTLGWAFVVARWSAWSGDAG